MSAIFTPDNEPYLGRSSVFHFDQMILVVMEQNAKIGPWTHGREMSRLQRAATELVPHGFSIALSIRELIRQGYLVSAEILLRPLIERAAVLSYLCEKPETVELWESGWPHKSRPALAAMLRAMRGGDSSDVNIEETIKWLVQYFNKIVHADPIGARSMAARSKTGAVGYSASKSLDDPDKCDEVCLQAQSYMMVLSGRAVQIFPEALGK